RLLACTKNVCLPFPPRRESRQFVRARDLGARYCAKVWPGSLCVASQSSECGGALRGKRGSILAIDPVRGSPSTAFREQPLDPHSGSVLNRPSAVRRDRITPFCRGRTRW